MQESNCTLNLKTLYYYPKITNEKLVFLKNVYILLHFFMLNKVITGFSFDGLFFFEVVITWDDFQSEIKKNKKNSIIYFNNRFLIKKAKLKDNQYYFIVQEFLF